MIVPSSCIPDIMYPAKFDYVSPRNLDEALEFLSQHREEAKVLAGGHSLIPLMKLRVLRPSYVVDLNRIPGLNYVREEEGELRVGSLTTYFDIESSTLLKSVVPILPETVSQVADPQVRNWGTLGGSLSHCDPAGDSGSAVIALRGQMVVRSRAGERVVASDDWFLGPFESALKPDEVLTEIRIPKPAPRSGGAYLKLERKTGDYAIVGVAAQLAIDQAGAVSYAGIGLTSVAPVNMRAKKAEAILLGRMPDARALDEAAQAAMEECRPSDDPVRGSAGYKRAMVGVYTKRALSAALERAKKGGA
jgi:carbon-monoxide dehydrogenase medium subunit